jgi:hypothetical protein
LKPVDTLLDFSPSRQIILTEIQNLELDQSEAIEDPQ